MSKLLKADLHIHTTYSMDCKTSLEDIINQCLKIGINCIAVADHGTAEGASKMQEMAPFTVIVAEEILTPYGEIIGMFLKETIPSGISAEQAVSRIRAQGALVGVPHPFDIFRGIGLGNKIVTEIAEELDFVEVFNARSLLTRYSTKARIFAQKHGIPGSAGSDAHTVGEIGNAYVEMPEFNGKEEFLQSLAKGKIFGRRANPFVHFDSIRARLRRQL